MTKRIDIPAAGKSLLGPTTRRGFMSGAGAIGLLAATSGLPSFGAKAAGVLRYADDGGANFDARKAGFLDPFSEKTGTEIRHYIGQRNLAKIKAMVDTGNIEFDIVCDSGIVAAGAGAGGLLQPIDKSKLDLADHMFPEWNSDTTVAFQYFAGGIAYNTKAIGDKPIPKTWADFWNVKDFPGRRGFLTFPYWVLEAALAADGVAAKDLYPLDVDRAYKSLDKIKSAVQIWVKDTGKTIEYLQNGELDYVYTSSARAEEAKKNGLPIDFIYDFAVSSPQNLYIVKGAENYDTAVDLMNFFLTNIDGGVKYFTDRIGYGPTSKAMLDKLPPEILAKLPSRDNPNSIWMNADWWGKNLEEVTRRHELWLLA